MSTSGHTHFYLFWSFKMQRSNIFTAKIKAVFFSTLAATLLFGLSATVASAQGPIQPTEHHKLLHNDVGDWDAVVKIWMEGPDAEPMVSKGGESNRLVAGGLWLVSDFHSQMGPMKFKGFAQIGYDINKKKYVGTWVDSMNSAITQMEGTYDAKTKTVTMESKGTDPATGKPMVSRNITRYIDKDHKVFEMHAPGPDGKFFKVMEISYTRKPVKKSDSAHGEHDHAKHGHDAHGDHDHGDHKHE